VTYDARHFWEEYRIKEREEFANQEWAIREALRYVGPVDSILEVGPGDGRVTKLLPPGDLTRLDIDPSRLRQPQDIEADLGTWWPDRQWDLVVAVEVLMHVPPATIEHAVAALFRASCRAIVTCDWTVPGHKQAGHNWVHDYGEWFSDGDWDFVLETPVGRQTVFLLQKFPRP
jgi:hypothetical protein